MTTDITALIAEARGFTAGSHPGNARSALINDLADALETEKARADHEAAEAAHWQQWFYQALERLPSALQDRLAAKAGIGDDGLTDEERAEWAARAAARRPSLEGRRRFQQWRHKPEPPSTGPTSPAGGSE